MNTAFLIIWILVFVFLLILVVYGFRNIDQSKNDKNIYIVDFNQGTCYPNGDVNQLPKTNNNCCVIDGVKTTKQQIIIENTNLNMIIDTIPQNYLEVCNDYCQNINIQNGKCDDNPQNSNGQYIECIKALKPPPGCYNFAIAVAQNNGIPYYAQEPSLNTNLITNPDLNGNCPVSVSC